MESLVFDYVFLLLTLSIPIYQHTYLIDGIVLMKIRMCLCFYCSLGYATTGAEDQPPRPPTGVPASGDYILPHTQLELGHSMVSAGTSTFVLFSQVARDLFIVSVF